MIRDNDKTKSNFLSTDNGEREAERNAVAIERGQTQAILNDLNRIAPDTIRNAGVDTAQISSDLRQVDPGLHAAQIAKLNAEKALEKTRAEEAKQITESIGAGLAMLGAGSMGGHALIASMASSIAHKADKFDTATMHHLGLAMGSFGWNIGQCDGGHLGDRVPTNVGTGQDRGQGFTRGGGGSYS